MLRFISGEWRVMVTLFLLLHDPIFPLSNYVIPMGFEVLFSCGHFSHNHYNLFFFCFSLTGMATTTDWAWTGRSSAKPWRWSWTKGRGRRWVTEDWVAHLLHAIFLGRVQLLSGTKAMQCSFCASASHCSRHDTSSINYLSELLLLGVVACF